MCKTRGYERGKEEKEDKGEKGVMGEGVGGIYCDQLVDMSNWNVVKWAERVGPERTLRSSIKQSLVPSLAHSLAPSFSLLLSRASSMHQHQVATIVLKSTHVVVKAE